MQSINETQDWIIEELEVYEDWMDKYAYLIELGNSLVPIDVKSKTEDNLIVGCQSQVWLTADINDQGNVVFSADSDTIITKGLISLLITILSNHTPDEILKADLYFIGRLGLKEHLSPTRANGLLAMVKQIRYYARVFRNQEKRNNIQN
jgi:SufE protein probably involved in Fe-S center assembly